MLEPFFPPTSLTYPPNLRPPYSLPRHGPLSRKSPLLYMLPSNRKTVSEATEEDLNYLAQYYIPIRHRISYPTKGLSIHGTRSIAAHYRRKPGMLTVFEQRWMSACLKISSRKPQGRTRLLCQANLKPVWMAFMKEKRTEGTQYGTGLRVLNRPTTTEPSPKVPQLWSQLWSMQKLLIVSC